MPWFKVDDKLHDHVKARRAGIEAMGLWVLSGSYAADNLTDGFVPEHTLTRWATSMAKGRKLAAALVEAGLWHPAAQDGEDGWRFHEWEQRQPTRAKTMAVREARAEAGRSGGVASGASRRGEANPNQNASGLVEPPSRPDPSRPDMGTSSRPLTSVPAGLNDDDLTKIAAATGGDIDHAVRVAADILGRATGTPSRPLAYVLRAVGDDVDRYRPTRRPPRKGEECPTHVGQWAHNCSGCAADRLAGGVL